jgi:hypothetical protein
MYSDKEAAFSKRLFCFNMLMGVFLLCHALYKDYACPKVKSRNFHHLIACLAGKPSHNLLHIFGEMLLMKDRRHYLRQPPGSATCNVAA